MSDVIPVLCPRCDQRWNHPANTITVVLMPGKIDQVWFVCPDCGPDHIRLDHTSAALIIYVFDPKIVDVSDVTPEQFVDHGDITLNDMADGFLELCEDEIIRTVIDIWANEQAGQ